MSALELATAMNEEDRFVAEAVRHELPRIAQAIETIAERLRKGGRLVYCGAGTSGRLGVLDAVGCAAAFSAPASQVVARIAGGHAALHEVVEHAEDSAESGAEEMRSLGIGAKDAVVGISTSGRTAYVIGALQHARAAHAATLALVCNRNSPVAAAAAHAIEVVPGPEVLTGSTRLKAGTAIKMVLNMLSTGAFVQNHKVYGNLMVDLQATNQKLGARALRIVAEAAGVEAAAAEQALRQCDGEVKTAIVVLRKRIDAAAARTLLFHNEGSVRAVLES